MSQQLSPSPQPPAAGHRRWPPAFEESVTQHPPPSVAQDLALGGAPELQSQSAQRILAIEAHFRSVSVASRAGPQSDIGYILWWQRAPAATVLPLDDRRPSPQALGQAVRALRLATGLSMEQLADAAGLHPTYLSDIELGKGNPTIGKLADLASVFGLPASRLIADAEDRTPAAGGS